MTVYCKPDLDLFVFVVYQEFESDVTQNHPIRNLSDVTRNALIRISRYKHLRKLRRYSMASLPEIYTLAAAAAAENNTNVSIGRTSVE